MFCRAIRSIVQGVLPALIGVLALTGIVRAEIITPSEYAVIMDFDSGKVLYGKNPDAPMKPASMAKMMTTYIMFAQIRDGSLKLDDKFIVSKKAYRKGGSRSFLEIGSQVTVEDLLRGIIVQSGNDAAIVVAEGLAGTEEAFADEMTSQARKLGMKNTVFGNATGWPDEITITTARDLAILARSMIAEFPDLYKIYAEKSFTYNGIKQPNRNPLLYNFDGADGLKTGHTNDSGYGLTASAIQDGQRIIMVINGLGSSAERKTESIRMMGLAFRTFRKFDLLEANAPVASAQVWLGVDKRVDLVSAETVSRVMDRSDHEKISKRFEINPDIEAPISRGETLGEAVFVIDGAEERFPLVAARDVAKLPWHRQIGAFFNTLIFGSEPAPDASGN
ncbi:MAG: D-alanyl-D-alanine carboxypeptidase family protein [Candidatus Puniceispirillales bacterium]